MYLADTSAVVRLINGKTHADWLDIAAAGRIAICPPVETELGVTTRNQDDFHALHTYLRATFSWLPVPDNAWNLVALIQQELVGIGHHRGPSTADLLVAAIAIETRQTLLHLDPDFEAIAKVAPLKLARADQPA
jgi:predicted nucleic acid-binding protein